VVKPGKNRSRKKKVGFFLTGFTNRPIGRGTGDILLNSNKSGRGKRISNVENLLDKKWKSLSS
jgi:hypothetical protein